VKYRCVMIALCGTGRSYLELVLRFRQLAPTMVEGYTGPPEIAAWVESEPQADPRELASHARELQHLVKHEPELDRRDWLSAQLAGVTTACMWLGGERLSYRELVKRCHGVNVTVVPEGQFELAHSRLDRVLSGRHSPRAL
jgi:hypothetical protein